MKMYKDGDHICLVWDGHAEDFFVKGHLIFEKALAVLEQEGCTEGYELGEPSHRYARWSCQGDAPDGCSHVLRDYKFPARGRFKVTMFPVI